jgi:type VI secretion system protein ImpL
VLSFLADHLAIVALLALLLIALLVLALVLWAAAQGADRERKAGAGAAPVRQLNLDSFRQSFRRAVELIEANLASRSERYNLSWTLVIHEADTEQLLPLVASGLPSALSTDATLDVRTHGMHWNFFDKGVAIQLQGANLGTPDEARSLGTDVWDQFLGLCRKYRPDRPFDAVVVAVPVQALMVAEPQSGLDLAARAKAVHRRLWLAQNRFALQFPVYLVVTGCDTVSGFTAFGQALPETLRRSMLGWSSPYELSAPFQTAWIDTGMDDITRDVQDACAELCALEPAGEDSADYFMLPAELERMRRGMKLFVEELMRTSAYHEPFFFRGFYLTGDCGEPAALRAALLAPTAAASGASAAGSDTMPAAASSDPSLAPSSGAPAGEGAPAPEEASASRVPAAAMEPTSLSDALEREPAFLRDLFEHKIFAEPGLVRASRVQRLQRPLVGRALRWTAVAVPTVWAVGLLVSTVRLSQLAPDIVAAVHELDRHGRSAGEPVDPARDRTRALGTLALMEHVEGGRFGAAFMPGSWVVFDDLQARLRRRLERGFSENAMEPLRLGAYARVSALTGVATDPATGTLITGSTCSLPPGWSAQVAAAHRSGLNVEDLPEFAALLEFAGRLEELDRGVRAMERLAHGPAAASGDDLRLAVRVFLGAEISTNLDRAAALLRKQSQSRAPLAIAPLQHATVCTFTAGMRALQTRLFEKNELMRAEQAIDAIAKSLPAQVDSGERGALQQAWVSLLEALRRQESLMVPGKGAWLQRSTLELGQAHDGLMQRMQGLGLVGPAAVADVQRLTREAFERFRGQWDPLRAEGVALLGPGLVWQDKETRWAFTPDRAALRDALSTLLVQPYMKPGHRSLPEPGAGQAVSWDRAKLDQALALADARRKFEAQLLTQFPPTVREEVDGMVRAAIADGMVDLLAQSVMFLPPAAAPAVNEADRLRLARAGTALGELGARGAAARLSQLLARDALVRLRRVDEVWRQGDFYQPREPDFRSWGGEKAPLPTAFGAGDAAGLVAYAANQQAFVDALAREAEALLPALEGNGSGLLVQRWRAITSDLARYRLKSPASSLAQLEQFVVTTAADVDLLNCADKVKVSPRRVGDVFAERLVALQTGLADRCRDLRQSETRAAWDRFAQAFNRELAGRAPFRAPAGVGTDRPPADPDESAAVLQAFERAQRLLGAQTAMSEPVRRFSEQMERVRVFLAPLYPAQPEAAAGYDIGVEFRANMAQEQQGHTIIDWSLTVGAQTLRAREPARALRWEPGMPVEVRLRLARDGPVIPQPEPSQSALAVEDPREVRYRFSDPWALLSLVSSQREAQGAARTDARAQLLRFDFPLAPAGVAASLAPEAARARVYLRLSISPVGKRAPLPWPGSFPVRAPEWSTP